METMRRIIETTLDEILSLISCASDYGFEDEILFDAFSDMLNNKLTNEEIESYARKIESYDGYEEEDYEEIKERLLDFKARYIQ